MKIEGVPFVTVDWSGVEPTVHKGETGEAIWRTFEQGNIRVRMVEYSPGYRADHWCARGHVLLVLEGHLTTELKDGRIVFTRDLAPERRPAERVAVRGVEVREHELLPPVVRHVEVVEVIVRDHDCVDRRYPIEGDERGVPAPRPEAGEGGGALAPDRIEEHAPAVDHDMRAKHDIASFIRVHGDYVYIPAD